MFPDVTHKADVINAPVFFSVIYQFVKRVLPERTLQKFVILGSTYEDKLVDGIGPESLYKHWGGDMVPTAGDE